MSVSVAEFARALTVEQLDEDPYPAYARLRREAPVCFLDPEDPPRLRGWEFRAPVHLPVRC